MILYDFHGNLGESLSEQNMGGCGSGQNCGQNMGRSGSEQNLDQNMGGGGSGQNCGRLLKVGVTFVAQRDSNMSVLSYFVAHIKTAFDDYGVDKEGGT